MNTSSILRRTNSLCGDFWAVVLLCVGVAGCLNTADPSRLKCKTQAGCPDGYVCTSGKCSRSGGSGGSELDASLGGGGAGGSRLDGGSAGPAGSTGNTDSSGRGGGDASRDDDAFSSGSDAPLASSNGATCTTDEQCANRHCVDGVCCESSCGGCSACLKDLTGKEDGTCAFVASGKVAHNACQDETAANQCGNDGTCDGNGACRKVGSNHICQKGSCSADSKTFVTATTCDGNGACTTATAQPCATSQCADTGCIQPCTTVDDCAKGNYCNATTKTCAAQKTNGQTAEKPIECTSGAVADGVCCDKECTGCSACTAALNGQDAKTTGQCLSVKTGGDDPHKTCIANPPCGMDGKCDGAGACRYPAANASCADAKCDGSTLTTSACDSSTHNCKPTAGSCPNALVCGSVSACKNTCASDSDCAAGNYCASGACKPQGAGTCSSKNECATGFCVDGHCCDSKCDGNCESCVTGTCSFTSAPRTSCGGSGKCAGVCAPSNRAACTFDNTTVCADQSCSNNSLKSKSVCDGQGNCPAQTPISCDSGLCKTDGSDCQGSCAGVSCGAGRYCAGSTCATSKNKGDACSDKGECLSGNCVDGYCCDGPCTGSCTSCSIVHGTCTNTTSPRAGKPCPGSSPCGASCTGSSPDCQDAGTSTPCGTATCQSTTQLKSAGTCDGQGSCSQSTQNCTCVANACADCQPNDKKCSTSTQPQKCDNSGHWVNDTACGSGQTCSGGNCSCNTNWTSCGHTNNTCYDSSNDNRNCGSASGCQDCTTSGKTCLNGACTCPYTNANCGPSCTACSNGATCSSSTHMCTCPNTNSACGTDGNCMACDTGKQCNTSGQCVCSLGISSACGGCLGWNFDSCDSSAINGWSVADNATVISVNSGVYHSASCAAQVTVRGVPATIRIPLCTSTAVSSFTLYVRFDGTPDLAGMTKGGQLQIFNAAGVQLDTYSMSNVLGNGSFMLFTGTFLSSFNPSYALFKFMPTGAQNLSGYLYIDDVSFK